MTYMSESASTTVPIGSAVEHAEESAELTLVEDGSARLPSVVSVQGLGKIIAASGLFKDAKQAAKATVKILAGQELGFAPIFSMTNVFIIEGKIGLGATLMAAKIRGSGRYDYKIIKHTNESCTVEIYEFAHNLPREGKLVGEASFDKTDARRANLLSRNTWKKYPRDMYFARAIGRCARWHVPHLFGGAVYTPDELGAIIKDDGSAVIIEGEVEDITEKVTPALNLKGSAAVIDEPTLSRRGGQPSLAEEQEVRASVAREHVYDLQAQGLSIDEIAKLAHVPIVLAKSWLGIPA